MIGRVVLVAFWLALCANSLTLAHAEGEKREGERAGAFLVTKDKVKIPREWGHMVAVYTYSGSKMYTIEGKHLFKDEKYTYLVFEDAKGTIRHVIYDPFSGIPGAVFQIDRE